ncbi:MAG TPA: retropepsin-like aspartic protease, partial [Niabella sp.]|nr:retropepsin-like aspartic protease [Niabella sp.]
MKQIKSSLLILLTSLTLNAFGQSQNTTFDKIYNLVEQKNFFKAVETYDAQKGELTTVHQKVIEAFLDNAFNRLQASNKKIIQLIQAGSNLPDSLMLKLYKTIEDNAVKLFNYKEAKSAILTIMANYKRLLSEDDRNGMENNLKIWTALEHEPKQQVKIKEANCLKMEKDKAGLNNLKVSSGKNTVDFIFDTGANLSTTSETAAKQLGMKIIPVDIEVGTITGETAQAQLAVCPVMTLGNIEIRNAVFLVLKDEGLAFPQIDYRINGILGFPVIAALKEIQTTQDGYFIVPEEETKFEARSNLAMDG